MSASTNVLAANLTGPASVTVAAAADIHCGDHNREAVRNAFEAVDGTVDLILLAGDLTTHGEPDQAAVLAEGCRGLATPVVAAVRKDHRHPGRGAQRAVG